MELRLSDTAKMDIHYFLKTGQKSIVKKIENLLKEIKENPFEGSGKPEALNMNYPENGQGVSLMNTGWFIQ